MCVFNLRYKACNAHAPYCHLFPVPVYNILPHYLINDTIFERKEKKKLLNLSCVFWFSIQLLSEAFLILRINERNMINNIWWSSCKVGFILFRFYWKFKFPTDCREVPKISWKSFQLEEPNCSVRTDGYTDSHDEANCRFCNFVNAPKTVWVSSYFIFVYHN